MPLSEEQRVIRRTGVTGSEVAVLVGLNPYKAPQDIYEDKLGLVERDASLDDNPNIERGVYLEPALIAWTGKRLGLATIPNDKTYVSPKHDLIIATPDGFAFPDTPYSAQAFHSQHNYELPTQRKYVIEVKAPSPRTYEEWADPEEVPDGIPAIYLPQVQWELAATELDEARVSALIGGQLKVYRVTRNQPFVDVLLRKVEAFWKYVQKQEPPPVDFARQVERDWLRKHFKSQREPIMREFLDGDDSIRLDKSVQDFMQLKEMADKLQEQLDQAKSILQFTVGDAAGFLTPGYQVTWKQAKGGFKTDWKRFVNTLKKAFPEKADYIDRVVTGCDYSYDGSRRLLVKPRKDG